jgi:pSer/pThr/pTyr-binding forkhead associated (FHA) protein
MTEDDLGLVVKAFLVGANDEQYPLYEGENTIGRHGTNMVQIMDSTSSRYHAVIEIHGDVYDYVDWRSTQPSVINGQPLAMNEHYSLKDGDQIKIGMTVLRFVIHQ